MKKFSIFRYLKQFSLLIFVLTIVGSVAIYRYGQSKQRYVASAIIQYTNRGAKDGYTPDGSILDVKEIYSSPVIDAALSDLGYTANVDSIRSKCYVEEVIPETQKKLSEVLLEKGEESVYFADTYQVFFVAGNDSSADYARSVLDAIIKNYCEIYAEKYVEQRLQNNAASVLSGGGYDFIESVQVLDDAVSQMLNYLLSQKSDQPYFRSIETGYTYGDLYNIYAYLYDYEIPSLYATILANSETDDIEVLMKRLNRDSEDAQLSISNDRSRAGRLKTLIDNYSNRNKEMMDYHYHNASSLDSGTEYIIKDVEYNRDGGDKETTYDSLIQEYVGLNTRIRQQEIGREHTKYLLGVFESSLQDAGRKTYSTEEIQAKIDHCIRLVDQYYLDVEETGQELNRFLSADYLKMVSSINVSTAVNIKLYLAIAIVLFTVVGGIGAVLLGRLIDFIDYFLYVDRTVGLPNRTRCDEFISGHSASLVRENFACLSLKITSLADISKKYGRAVGDEVLRDFAAILKSFGDLYGFVGYNGSGNFMAFFEDCSSAKLDVIVKAMDRQISEYNKLNPGHEIRYACGKVVSNSDSIFEIRDILSLAIRRMNAPAPAEKAGPVSG